jgi:hypothetical protein
MTARASLPERAMARGDYRDRRHRVSETSFDDICVWPSPVIPDRGELML